MRFIPLILLSLCLSAPSYAQSGQSDMFTSTPICSDLINKTGSAVYGAIETARAQSADGAPIYYKSNFRLKADETTQICSNGPFFPGQKLSLSIRSLFPLFECKTSLGQPITLTATPKATGSGYDWSATCY